LVPSNKNSADKERDKEKEGRSLQTDTSLGNRVKKDGIPSADGEDGNGNSGLEKDDGGAGGGMMSPESISG
jgi:hypothetical protein